MKVLQKYKIILQLFGGRGSSSSSGGGATGGLSAGDILETREMVAARSEHQTEVDEALGVFRDVYGEYGAQVEEIQLAKLKPGSAALAYYDSEGNIAFNESYFNKAKMDKSYEACVKSGFHPSNGNKSGLQAVAAHELGHKLTEDAARKMGKSGFGDIESTATRIVSEARKQTTHKSSAKMTSKISGYAKTNNAEAVAEAFADVYCNGKKARKESTAIVNVLNGYVKK